MSIFAGLRTEEIDLDKISGTSDMKKIKDLKGRPLLLWVNSWSIGMTMDRNPGLGIKRIRTLICPFSKGTSFGILN